ncbi:hypothetical protein EAF04_007858 [Stromatinia cepivora]|nr:hypothetical protein EAF04_007858 [Stromatinia cepivora]
MPIVERFKRGFNSIKVRFGDRSEPLQEPSQVKLSLDTTTSPVAVSVKKSGESSKQNDNEAASKNAPKSRHDDSACSITEPSTSISKQPQVSHENDFWLQASEKLQADDPELFEHYSLIICREGAKGDDVNSNKAPKTLADTATLLEICKNSLESMNSPSTRADKVLEKTVKIVGLAKDFVGSVVSAEPHAAVAWAGVCLFLPNMLTRVELLLNPSKQDDACRKGLEELPFLIQKYSLVERICTTEISNPTLASTQHTLSNAIVELYTKILGFQAEVICQSNRPKVKGYFRKVFQVDKWENMHQDVLRTEGRCWGLAQAIDSDRCSKLSEECKSKLAELYITGLEILKVSGRTYQAVINLGQESEQRERTKEEMECLQAFRSGNLYEEQKNITPDRVPGTCNWLLKDSTFIDWQQWRGSSLLWISADPGCGKSVLSKAFVDDRLVAATQSTVICYFFFKDVSVDQRSPTKAIAALLHQIFSSKATEHLLKHAMKAWKADGKELCNIADSMWAILGAIAADSTAGDIVCVIDALDECDDLLRDYFVRKLSRLVSGKTQCHIRFLVTSRPYPEIHGIFEELQIDSKSSFLRIAGEEESEAISSDIEMVIKHKVLRLPKLSDSIKLHLINRLQGMQNKTYLWLYLIWGNITTEARITGRHENFDKILDKLPDSVGDAYEAILNKSPHRSRTEKLLHIIVGAERPLSTDEINIAMNIKVCYKGTQTFEDIHLEDTKRYPDMLRNLCGLFIQIVDSKVYLIHQTAKEFLVETQSGKRKDNLWKHCLQPDTSQRILAEACNSYLLLADFDSCLNTHYASHNSPKTVGAERFYCFIDYSAEFWIIHYKFGKSFFDPADIVNLCSYSNRRTIWLNVLIRVGRKSAHRDVLKTCSDPESSISIATTSLMIISYFNLYEAGKHIISAPGFDKHELEACNGLYTPLMLAIKGESTDMVQLLIQSGAEANHYPRERLTPLAMAVELGDPAVLQSVLEVAVDERGYSHTKLTALDRAVTYTDGTDIYLSRIIPMLLNSMVHPMMEGYLESALWYAASYRNVESVELLLNSGADPNYGFFEGQCSWFTLANFFEGRIEAEDPEPGKPDTVADTLKLLLSKTETLPCEFVKTQLARYASVRSDEVDLMRLMLNHPRHPGLIHDGKQSPIVFAAVYAKMESMELLMNEPHDINKCKATMSCYELDDVERLAVKGRWTRADRWWSAIFGAKYIEISALFGGIISTSEKVVERLIVDGADTNMITELGTPLFFAAALSTKPIVQILIDKGAQITSFDDEGIEQPSPLVIAAARGDIEIMEALLKAGAKIDKGSATAHSILAHKEGIEGRFYPSAIQAAEMEGHEEMVRLLLEHKAKNGIAAVEKVDNIMRPGQIEELEDD